MRSQACSALSLLALALARPALTAQDLPERVSAAEVGLVLVEAGGPPSGDGQESKPVVGIAVPDPERPGAEPRLLLPFASPVERVDLGRYRDGSLAVLAGGVGTDLQVYVLGPDLESFSPLGLTPDRRRVPDDFDGGRGSWPMVVERGFFLVVCEGPEQPELRAWSTRGSPISIRRPFPLEVAGLDVGWDPRERRVRVDFLDAAGGLVDSAEYLHPVMPELAFVLPGPELTPLPEFGPETPEQVVVLTNTGPVDFAGELVTRIPGLAVQIGDSEFVTAQDCAVAAGRSLPIRLRWDPPAAGLEAVEGSLRATLVVRGEFPGVGARLPLRYRDAATRLQPGADEPDAEPDDAVAEYSEDDLGPAAAPAPAALRTGSRTPWFRGLDLSAASIAWLRPGLVRVELPVRVEGLVDAAATVRIRNARTGVVVAVRSAVGGCRPLRAEIPAAAFDLLELLPADPGADRPALPLGAPGPALHRVGDDLVVTAAPGAVVLLAEGAGLPLVPLSLREGRADLLTGQLRLAPSALEPGVGAVAALVTDPATGLVHRTAAVEVPDAGSPVRRDGDADRGRRD